MTAREGARGGHDARAPSYARPSYAPPSYALLSSVTPAIRKGTAFEQKRP
ncbi:hypothetical protein T261_3625 [Streptomyces lydicus]|nr:hypothetical protein T261_3625 [Streptomyces lydicus]